MGVVDKQFFQVGGDLRQPARRCRSMQVQHGEIIAAGWTVRQPTIRVDRSAESRYMTGRLLNLLSSSRRISTMPRLKLGWLCGITVLVLAGGLTALGAVLK